MCHFIARCVAIQYQVLQFSRHLHFVALLKFQTKLLNIKQQTVTLLRATIHGPKETSTVKFFFATRPLVRVEALDNITCVFSSGPG